MKSIYYVFFLSCLFISATQGQASFNLDTVKKHMIYVKAGIQPNLSYRIGYQQNFTWLNPKSNFTLYTELQGSFIRKIDKNINGRIGIILPARLGSKWYVFNDFFAATGHLETTHFSSNRFVLGDKIDFGLYKQRWSINLTVSYHWILASEIVHTQFYRDTFFSEAQDGWYKGAGGFFLVGLESNWLIAHKFDVGFAILYPFSQAGNSLGGAPANATVEIGWRF
ncbi:MAG: hypothetical protein AAFU67_11060 [Bacteroidota bacterium]